MTLDACPPKEELSDYLFGRIRVPLAEEVGDHIRRCSACQDTLHDFSQSPDPLVSAIKEGASSRSVENEPQLSQALTLIGKLFAKAIHDQTHPVSREAMQGDDFCRHLTGAHSGAHSGIDGIRLGQYRLLGLLGEGGMGTVYKALHSRLEMIVAVKVLSERLTHDRQSIARFDREMKAVGKVNHPNIIRATDAGEQNGIHYLAMDYVDGFDLGTILASHGPLAVGDACEAICQAAAGIQHAHALGLVHRDLKPSNLMVTREGQAKVLDLGLARLQVPQSERELTGDFQVMGTADYMAPEQALRVKEVDARADIYSLGCTLYALLCGKPPFSGPQHESQLKKLMAHDQEQPTAVHQRMPSVPQALSAIVDRAMAKSPDLRFSTAAEFADAIRPFAKDANLSALVASVTALRLSPSSLNDTSRPLSTMAFLSTPVESLSDFRDVQERIRGIGFQPVASQLEVDRQDAYPTELPLDRQLAPTPRQPGEVGPQSIQAELLSKYFTAPRRWSRVLFAVAILMLLGGALWGTILLRFELEAGTIMVEIEGDHIAAESDGAELIITDKHRDQSYRLSLHGRSANRRLPPGEYSIQVAQPGSGIRLNTQQFQITRRDRTVVTAYIAGRDAGRDARQTAERQTAERQTAERQTAQRQTAETPASPGSRGRESPDQAAKSLDRQAAERAIDQGAIVLIRIGESLRFVDKLHDLPTEDFFLTSCNFTRRADLTDEDHSRLSRLSRLDSLEVPDLALTEPTARQLARYPRLCIVKLRYEEIEPTGLEQLGRLHALSDLSIVGSLVGDAAVESLVSLTTVPRMTILGRQVTDRSLPHLAKMTHLEFLSLPLTSISGRGLNQLHALRKLWSLQLAYTPVTDEIGQDLTGFQNVTWLNLGGTRVTDEILKQVSQMPRLDALCLSQTGIRGSGLGHLRSVASLRKLDLRETKITDDAVVELASLTQLHELQVGNRLTKQALEILEIRLPRCAIEAIVSP